MTIAMTKKVNIVFALSEIFSMIFFIHGVQRLYIGIHGEKFNALLNDDFDKFYALSNETVSNFLVGDIYWAFYAFVFYASLIFFLNFKYKIHYINSLIVVGIVFFLFPLGYFNGIVNVYLNYFCALFGETYKANFLIGGAILTILGISILWIILKKHRFDSPLTTSPN
jgi:hypothetical protein